MCKFQNYILICVIEWSQNVQILKLFICFNWMKCGIVSIYLNMLFKWRLLLYLWFSISKNVFYLFYLFYLFLSFSIFSTNIWMNMFYIWCYVCTYFISIYNLHIVTYYYIGNAYTLVYKNTHGTWFPIVIRVIVLCRHRALQFVPIKVMRLHSTVHYE